MISILYAAPRTLSFVGFNSIYVDQFMQIENKYFVSINKTELCNTKGVYVRSILLFIFNKYKLWLIKFHELTLNKKKEAPLK